MHHKHQVRKERHQIVQLVQLPPPAHVLWETSFVIFTTSTSKIVVSMITYNVWSVDPVLVFVFLGHADDHKHCRVVLVWRSADVIAVG